MPFTDENREKLESKIRSADYEEIDGPLDHKTLIKDLLKPNPNDRINFSDIK